MIVWLIAWLAATIYVEAVTEVLVSGEIFAMLRAKLGPTFLGKLISCGYCLSVWVAATVFWVLPPILPVDSSLLLVFDGVVKLFVLHRVSNLFHELCSRWFKRVPFQLVLTKFENQPVEVPPPIEEKINVA
ncbi:MAG: DUF1360 domain-containing protein [Candidatus Nanopelagicaceae bacterium]|nr:DUF1360 domain-containing protein [Candidatus Nanopelagicaceae bacterium]